MVRGLLRYSPTAVRGFPRTPRDHIREADHTAAMLATNVLDDVGADCNRRYDAAAARAREGQSRATDGSQYKAASDEFYATRDGPGGTRETYESARQATRRFYGGEMAKLNAMSRDANLAPEPLATDRL